VHTCHHQAALVDVGRDNRQLLLIQQGQGRERMLVRAGWCRGRWLFLGLDAADRLDGHSRLFLGLLYTCDCILAEITIIHSEIPGAFRRGKEGANVLGWIGHENFHSRQLDNTEVKATKMQAITRLDTGEMDGMVGETVEASLGGEGSPSQSTHDMASLEVVQSQPVDVLSKRVQQSDGLYRYAC
jgi:hypothetical protein